MDANRAEDCRRALSGRSNQSGGDYPLSVVYVVCRSCLPPIGGFRPPSTLLATRRLVIPPIGGNGSAVFLWWVEKSFTKSEAPPSSVHTPRHRLRKRNCRMVRRDQAREVGTERGGKGIRQTLDRTPHLRKMEEPRLADKEELRTPARDGDQANSVPRCDGYTLMPSRICGLFWRCCSRSGRARAGVADGCQLSQMRSSFTLGSVQAPQFWNCATTFKLDSQGRLELAKPCNEREL